MRRLLAVPVGLALACGPGPPAPEPVPAAERTDLCRDIHNYYECSRVVEQRELEDASDRVRRHGDTLIIELEDGTVRRLVDRGTGPETVLLTYAGYLDRAGYHLVNVHFYEGGVFLLIRDAGGEELRVEAQPVASPDAERLVVASSEGVAGYAPNLLQVWRVAEDGLRLEWELEPDDWGAENAWWLDPSTVRFTKTWPCELHELCEAEATLRRTDGEWRLEADPAG